MLDYLSVHSWASINCYVSLYFHKFAPQNGQHWFLYNQIYLRLKLIPYLLNEHILIFGPLFMIFLSGPPQAYLI